MLGLASEGEVIPPESVIVEPGDTHALIKHVPEPMLRDISLVSMAKSGEYLHRS